MARRIADFNEMIDILSSIQPGQFVTMGYFSNSNARTTTRKSKDFDIDTFGQDLDANQESPYYNKLKQFQQGQYKKLPYGGIVKVTIMQFNWLTANNYNKRYSEYRNQLDAIQKKYGNYKEPEERKHGSNNSLIPFGKGGVFGSEDGKLYTKQRASSTKVLSRDFYMVDDNGNLLTDPVSPTMIKQLLPKSKTEYVEGLKDLQSLISDEKQLKAYTEEVKQLNFSTLQYCFDKILFVSCTYNGEKVFFINDNISNDAGKGLLINTNSFNEIVQNSLNKSNAQLKEIKELTYALANKILKD